MSTLNQSTYDYFQTLEVSAHVGCSVKCHSCPQNLYVNQYLDRYDGSSLELDCETFLNVLKNLKGSSVSKILFAGFSENFLNPQTPDLINIAHYKGFRVSVLTSGVGLSDELIYSLSDIPFDRFAFSFHSLNWECNDAALNPEEFLRRLALASITLSNVQLDVVCHPATRGTDLISYIRTYSRDHGIPLRIDWHDRAGNLVADRPTDNSNIEPPLYCGRPLTHVLQPSGDLALCCMDWGLKHEVGNLLKNTYIDILLGASTKKLLMDLQKGWLSRLICRNCHYIEKMDDKWMPITERPFYEQGHGVCS